MVCLLDAPRYLADMIAQMRLIQMDDLTVAYGGSICIRFVHRSCLVLRTFRGAANQICEEYTTLSPSLHHRVDGIGSCRAKTRVGFESDERAEWTVDGLGKDRDLISSARLNGFQDRLYLRVAG